MRSNLSPTRNPQPNTGDLLIQFYATGYWFTPHSIDIELALESRHECRADSTNATILSLMSAGF